MARIPICAAAAVAALGISAAACASVGSSAWSNLWWTHDQQGQRLLQSDQPDKAAARFSDPRRRAYADLRAGHYAQAANLLAPFHDVQSEYNRGNALARTGRLQDALDAYDAALAQAPNDRDTRHNRDLVARALRQSGKQQHRSQQHKSGQHGGASAHAGGAHSGSNGQQHGGQHGNGTGAHSGSKPQGSGAGQHGGSTGQQSGNKPQSRSASQQAGGQRQRGAATPSGAAGRSGDRQPSSQAAAAAAAAAQANRGRAASAAAHPSQAGAQNSSKGGQASAAIRAATAPRSSASAASKPESEQALSLEQWLRRIPDDPGGLLRRKFLIEHLARQRSANP